MLRGWLQLRPWVKHQETSADGKMLAIHQSRLPQKIKKMKLDKIDLDSQQYMKRPGKKCRRIKSGRIPFSPEASIWIRRAQVYRSLLRYHSGKIQNMGNLKRSARRCNIAKPLLLSIVEVKARLLFCKEKCNHFQSHGQQYRRKRLHNILDAEKDRKDEEAGNKILDIIRRERDRGFWRRINYAMGKHKKGLSVREVEIEDGSG